ncbi:DUF58 domain-containing protein [Methylocystis parvus]|uniref:DUF58 domain-containing protein n=1 Tax=Methylocystis parvus TaxID=134 RepID=A0A6B8M803_9HYPH|nr:DUF58 domain-containing protein [Methylocystis parvus]QGM98696.1 DUF58 domain-containing protein [Methylocystis parvus]WBK00955.1 DUF58 domain-containing protein [Methylocystis parvus OBBP]
MIRPVETRAYDPAIRADVDAAVAADLAASLPRLVNRAHEIAASVAYGVHGRKRAGQGETFWQYRPFANGEAAHRIDWRRSARSDQLYVREREWEAAHDYYLWMDCSPSMAFVSSLAQDDKLSRGVMLGFALADVLVRGGERVAALGLTAPISARDVIDRLSRALYERAAETARDDLPPDARLRPRARVVLISDFLCDLDGLSARLRRYADAGASGALLMVIDPSEESFPFSGETMFLDTDGGPAFHAGDARSLRDAYAQRFDAHREAVRETARASGFLFLQHHTDRPAAEAALALAMGLHGVEETL